MLRAVDLVARAGEISMVLGVSGSGKTTLLKLCKGLLAPRGGSVRVLGDPVAAPSRARLDPRVAYIPQQLGLALSLTVLENVLIGALSRVPVAASIIGWVPEAETARARELLARLRLGSLAEKKAYAISGGERQRVAIARSLMQRPRVLLADEFISDLDPVTSETIMAVVREIAGEGVCVLMTTHEMDVVSTYADHVIVLRDGAKVLDERAPQPVERIVAAFR